MALVRDNILVPTKDAPELAYIRKPFLQHVTFIFLFIWYKV